MKVLVVAAHPDDEVLGCGGTIARQDNHTDLLILCQRHFSTIVPKVSKVLGIKSVTLRDFPDNRFDNVPLLSIIEAVELVVRIIKPDIIYTHSETDLNIDHVLTYKSVMTACRPGLTSVKEIYSFEVLSSTEWSDKLFIPNVFVDISATINKKIEAMQLYSNELKKWPHPRSIEGITVNAAYRGMMSGLKSAEAFKLVRRVCMI